MRFQPLQLSPSGTIMPPGMGVIRHLSVSPSLPRIAVVRPLSFWAFGVYAAELQRSELGRLTLFESARTRATQTCDRFEVWASRASERLANLYHYLANGRRPFLLWCLGVGGVTRPADGGSGGGGVEAGAGRQLTREGAGSAYQRGQLHRRGVPRETRRARVCSRLALLPWSQWASVGSARHVCREPSLRCYQVNLMVVRATLRPNFKCGNVRCPRSRARVHLPNKGQG